MLKKMVERYIKELEISSASKYTVINYRKHLEKFQAWCENTGAEFLALDVKQAREFRNYLVDQGLAPKTINTILGAVKAFYDFLIEEEAVTGNPILMKRLHVKEEKRKPDFLPEADLQKVTDYLNNLPDHVALAFRTMLAAGLRVSEAAALTPEDVIMQNGSVFLRVRHGKGDKERYAPVTDAATAKELVRLAKETDKNLPLFKISVGTLKVYAWRIKQETGIEFHAHRMRHTLATRLLAEGTPLDVVQKVLGHENISTTRKYAETMPEALFRVAAKVS